MEKQADREDITSFTKIIDGKTMRECLLSRLAVVARPRFHHMFRITNDAFITVVSVDKINQIYYMDCSVLQ